MGALHEGHFELIRKANESNRPVVVSIFVNPTQFGPLEDFGRYPRSFESDCAGAERAGAGAVFAPDVSEIYPRAASSINVPEVTELYEGAIRPGHFAGVSTVVLKLFNIVQCEAAFFGLKDLQQCAVIQRMVWDLNVPVALQFLPTVREPDGLAMSSRNAYLDPQNRALAPLLFQSLATARSNILAGEEPLKALDQGRSALSEAGFQVDYLDLIDRQTFKPTADIGQYCAVIAAARLGNTRLIDNVLVFSEENMP